MPAELTDMTIEEISLVDDPANEQARVLIVKAKKSDYKKEDDAENDDDEDDDPVEMDKAEADGLRRLKEAVEKLAPELVRAMVGGEPINPDAASEAAASIMEYNMDIEALSKALGEAESKLETLEKRAEEAEAALAERDEIIKAKDSEIADLRKAAGDDGKWEPSEEEVIKSLPESIRQRLEAAKVAEQELAKARAEGEEREAIAKAKELGVGKPEELGPLLLRVAKGKTTEDDAKALEGLIKALKEQTVAGALFRSFGSTEAVDGDPETLLKAKADEIKKANPSLSFEQAYDKAMTENPALYAAYTVNKRRVAVAA